MPWAAHFKVNDGRSPGAGRAPKWRVFLALFGCMTLASCGATYDRGVEAAQDIMVEAGVGPNDRGSIGDIGLAMDLHGTDFGRTVREAVLSFPALANQQSQMLSADARIDALTGELRPQLSSGLSAGQTLTDDDGGASVDARVTVRQLLFDGAATRNRIALAHINQHQLNFELDTLLSSLSRQMASAGLELWLRSELLVLAEDDAAAHEMFIERIEARVAGGVGAESDLLSAQSRFADARARLAQARSALAEAQATYAALIGALPNRVQRPPVPPRMAANLARERITHSSRMALVRLRLAEAQSRRDVIVSSRYPGVSVQLTGARTNLFADDADNEVFWGLSVDQTLFSGGQQRAREREAESDLAAAQAGVDEAERQLTRALDVALANREAAAFEAEAAAAAALSNEANLAAVQDQFGIGRRSITDILDAQRDFTAARVRQITVQASRIDAELAILELTGDLAAVFGIEYDPYAAHTDVSTHPIGLAAAPEPETR